MKRKTTKQRKRELILRIGKYPPKIGRGAVIRDRTKYCRKRQKETYD